LPPLVRTYLDPFNCKMTAIRTFRVYYGWTVLICDARVPTCLLGRWHSRPQTARRSLGFDLEGKRYPGRGQLSRTPAHPFLSLEGEFQWLPKTSASRQTRATAF
jgi:hypothetical protein